MRDPQASKSNTHTADAHQRELDALSGRIRAAVCAERPIPVADPVHDDRNGGGDDLGNDRTFVQRFRREDCDTQQVEDANIHDQPKTTDGGKPIPCRVGYR